jgi:twitching motility protein PilI
MADAPAPSTRKAGGRLREFTAQLAQRLQSAPAAGASEQRLLVRIGAQDYLVALAQAAEVVPLPALTPVPWSQPWFRGLANVRGRLVGAIDLQQFAGGTPLGESEATQLLVFGAALPVNAALLISRAAGLRDRSRLQPAPPAPGPAWCATRWIDDYGAALAELDLAALAADEGFCTIAS